MIPAKSTMSITSTLISGCSLAKVSAIACAARLCPAPTLPCTIKIRWGGELNVCSPSSCRTVSRYRAMFTMRMRNLPTQTTTVAATIAKMFATSILGTTKTRTGGTKPTSRKSKLKGRCSHGE